MDSKKEEIIYTPSGSPIIPTYEKVTENGDTHLIETGTTNIYDKIQESKDECDIRQIIAKCTAGDPIAIAKLNDNSNVHYGDYTMAHKSLNEINQIQKEASKTWNAMTEQERETIKNLINNEEIKVEEQKVEETKLENENKGVKYE